MGHFKGSGMVFVKDKIAVLGKEKELEFYQLLGTEEQKKYSLCVSISRPDIEFCTRILTQAAEFLHGNKTLGLKTLGYEMAKDHSKGIYQIVARITTIPFFVKKASAFWNLYHDEGKGSAEHIDSQTVHFIVSNYPSLPTNFRLLLDGYIYGLIEVAGGLNISVTQLHSEPNCWKWLSKWA